MKLVLKNKKAFFEYNILDKFEAGIVLNGCEVKSLRKSKVNFVDAYCEPKNGELFIIGLHINNFEQGTYNNLPPRRDRKLLLHKNEIIRITNKMKERGFSCVPLSIYFNDKNKVKLEIALAKGKRLIDKRETIKKRDNDRELKNI